MKWSTIILGVSTAAASYISSYATNKLEELDRYYVSSAEKEKKKRKYFDDTYKDSEITLRAFIPSIEKRVNETINPSITIAKIKQIRSGNQDSSTQSADKDLLWTQLKVEGRHEFI